MKLRTLRVTVAEELTERQTIDVDIPHDLDITDKEALDEFLEGAWTGTSGGYRPVGNTKEVAISDRWFFEPVIQTEARSTRSADKQPRYR